MKGKASMTFFLPLHSKSIFFKPSQSLNQFSWQMVATLLRHKSLFSLCVSFVWTWLKLGFFFLSFATASSCRVKDNSLPLCQTNSHKRYDVCTPRRTKTSSWLEFTGAEDTLWDRCLHSACSLTMTSVATSCKQVLGELEVTVRWIGHSGRKIFYKLDFESRVDDIKSNCSLKQGLKASQTESWKKHV